jgi:glycogen debranching enzyme
LLKATTRWLASLARTGAFPHKGVNISEEGGSERLFTYDEWDSVIKANFHVRFYVPADPSDDEYFGIDRAFVHRRGIYKVGGGWGGVMVRLTLQDTYNATRRYEDYRLRPNALVAMVVVRKDAGTLFKF